MRGVCDDLNKILELDLPNRAIAGLQLQDRLHTMILCSFEFDRANIELARDIRAIFLSSEWNLCLWRDSTGSFDQNKNRALSANMMIGDW